jgi:hypothetical protein
MQLLLVSKPLLTQAGSQATSFRTYMAVVSALGLAGHVLMLQACAEQTNGLEAQQWAAVHDPYVGILRLWHHNMGSQKPCL